MVLVGDSLERESDVKMKLSFRKIDIFMTGRIQDKTGTELTFFSSRAKLSIRRVLTCFKQDVFPGTNKNILPMISSRLECVTLLAISSE